MSVGTHALEITLMLAAPMLLVALVVGLLVGIFQAATQINEMTMTFVPKISRKELSRCSRNQLTSRSGWAPILWIDRSAPSNSSSCVSRKPITALSTP